ncbi:MAG: hypothetical protein GKR77_04190 [Legionellales bacterium]|nr:hypothetical protein [Legionellales bacterium]
MGSGVSAEDQERMTLLGPRNPSREDKSENPPLSAGRLATDGTPPPYARHEEENRDTMVDETTKLLDTASDKDSILDTDAKEVDGLSQTSTSKTFLQTAKAIAPYVVGAIVVVGLVAAITGFAGMGGFGIALAAIKFLGVAPSAIMPTAIGLAFGGSLVTLGASGGYGLFKKVADIEVTPEDDSAREFPHNSPLMV